MNNKNTLIKLLLLVLILGSTSDTFAQRRSEKRGVGEDTFAYTEEILALSPGVSWFYNWGIAPANVEEVSGPGRAMEYYPMTWGVKFNEAAIRKYMTDNPGVKYLLAFNEPNFHNQANMTPAEAVEKWQILEGIARDFDLEIVGPALNYSPNPPYYNPFDWYDEFFSLLPEGSQVDYLALHCYMISSDAMMDFVNTTAERYNKKIWLTEFCAWDNLPYPPAEPTKPRDPNDEEAKKKYEEEYKKYEEEYEKYKEEVTTIQKNTMVSKVEALELSPNVAKYAWFKAKNADERPFMRLLHYRNLSAGILPGTLTELGEMYVHMSSFDLDHYYDTENLIPVTNYVRSEYISLELNTDPESPFKLQLESFGAARVVDYLIDIPAAGTYPLNIRTASEEDLLNPYIEVYSDGKKIAEKQLKATGSINKWETRVIDIPLQAGKQRLTLKSKKNTTCKISWISLSNKTSDINTESSDLQEAKLERIGNQLQVNTQAQVENITILNMSGCLMKSVSGQSNVDISSLPKGIYLVTVTLSGGIKNTMKWIN